MATSSSVDPEPYEERITDFGFTVSALLPIRVELVGLGPFLGCDSDIEAADIVLDERLSGSPIPEAPSEGNSLERHDTVRSKTETR
jgi:hypothetical protein